MLELMSRHTANGCTYLQAILLIVSVATAVCLFLCGVIPFFAAEIREEIAYKKSSQQEGLLTEGRSQKINLTGIYHKVVEKSRGKRYGDKRPDDR